MANAATTTTTSRVTRFRPRFESGDRLLAKTLVCHKRMHIRKYSPLIKINGITYELEKKVNVYAAAEM